MKDSKDPCDSAHEGQKQLQSSLWTWRRLLPLPAPCPVLLSVGRSPACLQQNSPCPSTLPHCQLPGGHPQHLISIKILKPFNYPALTQHSLGAGSCPMSLEIAASSAEWSCARETPELRHARPGGGSVAAACSARVRPWVPSSALHNVEDKYSFIPAHGEMPPSASRPGSPHLCQTAFFHHPDSAA